MPVPADIYKDDVDFTALALRYPEFAKKLKSNRQLDFSDPESLRQLTKALLKRDFDLTIDLPDDRLCPPVPNRFNYVLFVQRLLDSTSDTYSDRYDPNRRVVGLDIGTGASAIYPLLACHQRPNWLFLATEVDAKSAAYATQNVTKNDLGTKIKVVQIDSQFSSIIPVTQLQQIERVDILLTNPPFYTSQQELESLAKQKSRPPNSACTGAPVEMICPGGEIGFVSQIVLESKTPQIKKKVQWFSSMLGKLGSVTVIVDKLKAEGCTNFAVTEFVQGQKTRRWCVAWSWLGLRPTLAVARGTDAVDKKYLPFPTEMDIPVRGNIHTTVKTLNEAVSQLPEIQWRWKPDALAGVGRSMSGDVWSRQARRNYKRIASIKDSAMDVDVSQADSEDEDDEEVEPKFAFKITCEPTPSSTSSSADGTAVHLRWLQGQDSALFESFHGWLRRKLTG